jgi:hypothetical protein
MATTIRPPIALSSCDSPKNGNSIEAAPAAKRSRRMRIARLPLEGRLVSAGCSSTLSTTVSPQTKSPPCGAGSKHSSSGKVKVV